MTVDYLVRYHEKRGDKIMIFIDQVFTLKEFAKSLGVPYLCGDVSEKERTNIIDHFKNGSEINVIACSRVADTSIDIPNANVLI